MNQVFSFERFKLLVAKHWADNKKRYGLSILAFAGLLTIWYLFALFLEEENALDADVQLSTFYLFLFVTGTFYASQYFRDLSSKPRASNFLLLPASTFEKFLCSILFTIVLFFIIFTSIFYLIDFIMVEISNSINSTEATGSKSVVVNIFTVEFFEFDSKKSLNFLMFYFAIQSIFLFGSAYFKKYNFIKTILSGLVAWFLIFFLIYFIHRQNTPDDVDMVEFPGWIALIISILVYSLAPVLWLLTFIQLKTKQV